MISIRFSAAASCCWQSFTRRVAFLVPNEQIREGQFVRLHCLHDLLETFDGGLERNLRIGLRSFGGHERANGEPKCASRAAQLPKSKALNQRSPHSTACRTFRWVSIRLSRYSACLWHCFKSGLPLFWSQDRLLRRDYRIQWDGKRMFYVCCSTVKKCARHLLQFYSEPREMTTGALGHCKPHWVIDRPHWGRCTAPL
jgi:hypothetical protein